MSSIPSPALALRSQLVRKKYSEEQIVSHGIHLKFQAGRGSSRLGGQPGLQKQVPGQPGLLEQKNLVSNQNSFWILNLDKDKGNRVRGIGKSGGEEALPRKAKDWEG